MMALGNHIFYAADVLRLEMNRGDYYIGALHGDHWNDEAFGAKLKRVMQRLIACYGVGGFTYYWAPAENKPYTPLTNKQKYKRAVTKAYNKHKNRVMAIIQDNSLFVDSFLAEETTNHYKRIETLKQRYL